MIYMTLSGAPSTLARWLNTSSVPMGWIQV